MFKRNRLDHLDFLRGIVAFLVLSSHLRAFTLQSFGSLQHPGVPIKAFYFVTGLGHQAVIMFFALSGFLVGGKALQDLLAGRFTWSRYILRRLTRLWIVILPALLLTLVFDTIGLALTHGKGYDGSLFGLFAVGPSAPVDLSLPAFGGNLAFLQTIYVPTFGSNGPMWSLANEFWYYVIFPLAAWVLLARATAPVRIAGLSILGLILSVLPAGLLEGGAIWVAGGAAAYCARHPALSAFLKHIATRAVAIALLCSALALSKMPGADASDLPLGFAVALALPVLATLPSPAGLYSAFARSVSEISYTLYLTHFPLLALLAFGGIVPIRLEPGLYAAGLYIGVLGVAFVWAAAVWWCFERNTDRIYSLISRAYLAPAGSIIR